MIQLTGDAALIANITRLSAVMQKRLLKDAADIVVKLNKNRISRQMDEFGTAYQKRASGKKKKMLMGLRKRIRITSLSENSAVIGFASAKTSSIALIHQEGRTITVTAAQLKKNKSRPTSASGGATRRQAKILINLGFRARKNNRFFKPTLKYIQANYSLAQAGAIIRSMRKKQGIVTKKSWQVTLPVRQVLAIDLAIKKAIREKFSQYNSSEKQ